MKVEFEIECTPEEARKFLGLPDVIPMQTALMQQLQDKMAENIRTLDPESLAKTWVPLTMQSYTDMQKMFWSQLGAGTKVWTQNAAEDAMAATENATRTKPKSKK
jgi:hypothetical protein